MVQQRPAQKQADGLLVSEGFLEIWVFYEVLFSKYANGQGNSLYLAGKCKLLF